MAEVVRTPIGPDARRPKRRTLDERLYVRWPWLFTALARAATPLPPHSRLRRALLRRHVLSGWAAWARQDLELVLVRYAPDCKLEPDPGLLGAGMRGSYHGHAGVRDLAADWREAWEWMDHAPETILDAGNRIVVLGHYRLRARGSGIEFDRPVAQLVWHERGLVRCERDFTDRDEALRAAGLSE